MLLSTQTEALATAYGLYEAIRMLAGAGFDAFDLSLFDMFGKSAFNEADYLDYARDLRDFAEDCGILCSQAHAPFDSRMDNADEERFRIIVRSMEAASIVGAGIIVVHPLQYLDYRTHKEELFEANMKFYRRLIPYCQEFGIKVACENMWQDNVPARRIRDSVCSRPEEFCRYIDELQSPWIVACMDVGHVVLTDEDLGVYVRTLGPRLQALHVHDNDLSHDDHTLPFTRAIDFSALTTALRDNGYEGDFTFEADCFLQKFPQPLVPEALRLMEKTGRFLLGESLHP